MSIANVNMFEFEDEEALKTFSNWYSGNGADDYMKYADCEIILMIQTSPTSCLTVANYPNDEARQKAVALREGRHSDAIANFLEIEHTIALEGEVKAKRLKEILT
jgi:hypothetical protein